MNYLAYFLGFVTFAIVIGILIANIYILAYFSHPEDTSTKGIYVYRILVIIALSCSCFLIFAIPLDLANIDRDDSMNLGYPMDWIWTIINNMVALSVLFLLPFALIMYTDDGESFVYL